MSAEEPRQQHPSPQDLLESIILATVDIPSLPPIARKVLQIVNDDRSSMTELEDLIYKDHSFSTRLLRIANSSFYGRRQSVTTISDAVLITGFKTLKSLVVGASMRDLNRRFGPIEQRLWQHSLAVSIAASLLARETKVTRPEEALVAGLVHDVGKTIMNNSIAHYYASIVEAAAESGVSSMEAEDKAFGFNHSDVGGYIARKWLFPADLVSAVQYHHAEALPSSLEGQQAALCRIVAVADTLCLRLGIGTRRAAAFSPAALEELRLTEQGVLALGETVKHAYAEHASYAVD